MRLYAHFTLRNRLNHFTEMWHISTQINTLHCATSAFRIVDPNCGRRNYHQKNSLFQKKEKKIKIEVCDKTRVIQNLISLSTPKSIRMGGKTRIFRRWEAREKPGNRKLWSSSDPSSILSNFGNPETNEVNAILWSIMKHHAGGHATGLLIFLFFPVNETNHGFR